MFCFVIFICIVFIFVFFFRSDTIFFSQSNKLAGRVCFTCFSIDIWLYMIILFRWGNCRARDHCLINRSNGKKSACLKKIRPRETFFSSFKFGTVCVWVCVECRNLSVATFHEKHSSLFWLRRFASASIWKKAKRTILTKHNIISMQSIENLLETTPNSLLLHPPFRVIGEMLLRITINYSASTRSNT